MARVIEGLASDVPHGGSRSAGLPSRPVRCRPRVLTRCTDGTCPPSSLVSVCSPGFSLPEWRTQAREIRNSLKLVRSNAGGAPNPQSTIRTPHLREPSVSPFVVQSSLTMLPSTKNQERSTKNHQPSPDHRLPGPALRFLFVCFA